MMNFTPRHLRFRYTMIVLCVATLLAPVLPVWGAQADVDVFLFWTATGTANPDLTYHFQTLNQGRFSSMTTPELLLPVTFFGRILKDGSASLGTCSDSGFVEDLFFECWEPSANDSSPADCPFAQGLWNGQAQMTTLTQAWSGISDSVFANCPTVCTDIPSLVVGSGTAARADSPVSPGFDASLVTGVDLETGYQLDQSVARSIPRGDLHRVEKIDGTTYVLDEYAVVHVAPGESHVERASSVRTVQDAAAWGRAIREQKAQEPRGLTTQGSGRYLIIQGMEHLTGERRPMVKFRPPSGTTLGTDEQLVVRARFSEAGQVEEVETLQGNPLSAREIVEGIELVFIQGSEHRVVVYAVFQGGDRLELTAAIPTFIQCCCDGFLCPG